METLTLNPFKKPFDRNLAPPGSKSLTNRALVVAALARGTSHLRNILLADDTAVMIDGLRKLGFRIDLDETARSLSIEGQSGDIPSRAAELFCGNSGTTIRFLSALCALGTGEYVLDGIARMRQRPIGQLIDMLKTLGVRVEYLVDEGYPPIRILEDPFVGGLVGFGASQSSQYLSAVLMASPYANEEVEVQLEPGQTSWPYVVMTMRLMDLFGITPELARDPETQEPQTIYVPRGKYKAVDYHVEPDASNATYLLAAAALHKGARITVAGLGEHSLQGDVGFAKVLQKMGANVRMDSAGITVEGTGTLRGIDVDLLAMPDTAQTLAVVALFADSPTTIRGLHTLKLKETDRLQALVNELAKFGAKVSAADGQTLQIIPPNNPSAARIATYDDHRMAMSFALAGTRTEGVVIEDPACVNKTYPEYFKDLESLRAD